MELETFELWGERAVAHVTAERQRRKDVAVLATVTAYLEARIGRSHPDFERARRFAKARVLARSQHED
jgi:hypothetical protein